MAQGSVCDKNPKTTADDQFVVILKEAFKTLQRHLLITPTDVLSGFLDANAHRAEQSYAEQK